MKLNAKQELAQKQTLSQAQVQSLTVLAMTGDELEQFVQREVEDNPLLEQPDLTAAPVSQTGGCRVSLSRSSGEDEAAYRDVCRTRLGVRLCGWRVERADQRPLDGLSRYFGHV